jgi:hypothetical protein
MGSFANKIIFIHPINSLAKWNSTARRHGNFTDQGNLASMFRELGELA